MFLGETLSLTTRIVQFVYDPELYVAVTIPFKATEAERQRKEKQQSQTLQDAIFAIWVMQKKTKKTIIPPDYNSNLMYSDCLCPALWKYFLFPYNHIIRNDVA